MCFVLFDLFPRKTSRISKGHVSATPSTAWPGREMLEPADMEKLLWEDKSVGAVLGPVALLYNPGRQEEGECLPHITRPCMSQQDCHNQDTV